MSSRSFQGVSSTSSLPDSLLPSLSLTEINVRKEMHCISDKHQYNFCFTSRYTSASEHTVLTVKLWAHALRQFNFLTVLESFPHTCIASWWCVNTWGCRLYSKKKKSSSPSGWLYGMELLFLILFTKWTAVTSYRRLSLVGTKMRALGLCFD